MKLSIVIPAYNEISRLQNTIFTISEYFKRKNIDYEILVVDDGSRDGTGELVKSLQKINPFLKLIQNRRNFGKGFSVKRGVIEANSEFILITDADLSTSIDQFDEFYKKIEGGYDIVIGSRGVKEAKIIVHQPFYREIMGKTFNCLVRLFTGLPYKDTQCGFKLFRGNLAKEIFRRQKTHGFAFDVEVLIIAKKIGARVLEYPVVWKNSKLTKVKILRHSWEMFIDLVRLLLFRI